MLVNEYELTVLVAKEISINVWDMVEETAELQAESACSDGEYLLDDEGRFELKLNTCTIRKNDDGTRNVEGTATVMAIREYGRIELDDWFEQAVTTHVSGVAKAEEKIEFSIGFDRIGQITSSSFSCRGDIEVSCEAA